MSTTTELKPCPFCGSKAHMVFSQDGDDARIMCDNWKPGVCLGSGPWAATREKAIAAWNRRTAAQGGPSDYEALEREHLGDPDKRTGIYHPDVIAARKAVSAPAQGEPSKATDISQRLRAAADAFTTDRLVGLNATVERRLLVQAADEIERYYGGMLAWKATAEAKDRQAGSAEQVASSDAASKYTALENDWNHLMDALNCDDTDSALAKIAALQHTAHVPSKPMSEMKALQAVVRENNTLHAALELACSHLTDDQVEQVSAAMPAREAVPSKSEELPTLPKNLLDLIGEYGMARTDGLNDLDVQHRWLNLIDGIKDYAFSCLQNTSRPSKAGEWTDAEIHEHAYLHASAHIRPPDSESFYEFTHKDLVKFARAILAAQADGPVIDYGTKNATQPLIAEAARDDAIGEGLDEVDQPYAGTIVLLETIAQYGAKSFDDGNPTPMRALCLRFAAEIRADQSQIALQHAAPAQAQSEDARDDGPDLTNADIPAGSAYGSTLDQLYAAFHREPCGDTLAAIGAAIQELQAMQPDHRVDDLVALVRQLARSLSKAAPDHALPAKAMDYLQRKGLQGSPLRDDVVGAFNELKDRLQGIMRYDNVSGTYSIPAAEFLDAINIIQDAAIAKERENHEQNI